MKLECNKCLVETKVYKSDSAEIAFVGVYRYALLDFEDGEEPELDSAGNADDIYFSDSSELSEYQTEEWRIISCSEELEERIKEIIEENGFVESELEEIGLEYNDGSFSIVSNGPFKASLIEE